MTRYRAGDMVQHGARQGEIVCGPYECGYSSFVFGVRFNSGSLRHCYVMADKLEPVVERLPVALRVVGGTDMEVIL